MSDYIKNLEIEIPEDLGEIEFLREHPLILSELIKRSVDLSLKIYTLSCYAPKSMGGFNWHDTEEGFDFWDSVINDKNIDLFYELL